MSWFLSTFTACWALSVASVDTAERTIPSLPRSTVAPHWSYIPQQTNAPYSRGHGRCLEIIFSGTENLTAAHCIYWWPAQAKRLPWGKLISSTVPFKQDQVSVAYKHIDVRRRIKFLRSNKDRGVALFRLADGYPEGYLLLRIGSRPRLELQSDKRRTDKHLLVVNLDHHELVKVERTKAQLINISRSERFVTLIVEIDWGAEADIAQIVV